MWWRFRAVLMHRDRDKMATFRRQYLQMHLFQRLFWHFDWNFSLFLKSLIDNTLALTQVMAWFSTGEDPSPETMMTISLTRICVALPQYDKLFGLHEKFQEDSGGFIYQYYSGSLFYNPAPVKWGCKKWLKWDRIKKMANNQVRSVYCIIHKK